MDGRRSGTARRYIEEAKEHGKPDDEVRAALRRAGWEDGDLDELFATLPSPPNPAPAEHAQDARSRIEGQRPMKTVTVVVAWLWLVLSAVGVIAGLGLVALSLAMNGYGGPATLVTIAFVLAACATPFLAALGLMRRRTWGWRLLVIIASAAGLLSAVCILLSLSTGRFLTNPEGAIGTLSAAALTCATVVILLRDPPRDWVTRDQGASEDADGPS